MTSRTRDEQGEDQARLIAEIVSLRARLEDAEATLAAVRSGEVDAVVVNAEEGEKIDTLEGSDRPYRLMIEAMQQGAAILDRAGRVLYANLHFAALLGRPLEQVMGAPLATLLPSSQATPLLAAIEEVTPGATARTEVRLEAGGRVLPIEMVVHTLPFQNLLCVIATDLSQQRQYEDLIETKRRLVESEAEHRRLYIDIKEADRRKDEFLAMLAHELRNPLAPIRNALHLLKMETDPEIVRQAHEMLERQTQNIVRLVDDLLDVSRIMSGKIELRRSVVPLAQVLERAIEIVRPTIDAQDQDLSVVMPAGAVLVEVDAVRMAQAIANLLANAAKYTDRRGRIEIGTSVEESNAVIRIRDSGIGIAADVLPRIFDLFVQADPALARSQGGLGIGLTLVRRIVEMHGGGVSAFSEGPGAGSEFAVRLPLAAADGVPARDGDLPQVSRARTSCRRVLVVDDNPDAAESTATLLRLWGHDVRIAYEGSTAIEVALQHEPNIVLLDIGLPGMSGYEVAAQMRTKLGKKSVLVAMTGYGQEEDRRRSQEAGFDLHLTKPLEPGLLEAFVASV